MEASGGGGDFQQGRQAWEGTWSLNGRGQDFTVLGSWGSRDIALQTTLLAAYHMASEVRGERQKTKC